MISSLLVCEKGPVRPVNQDRAGRFEDGTSGLYLVADGMGGHYGGEKASSAVLDGMSDWWERFRASSQRPGIVQGMEQLRAVLERAHRSIQSNTPPGLVCGTTVTALLIAGGEYALLSCGDSRCYLLPGRFPLAPSLRQLTHDDVVPPGSKDAGKLLCAVGAGSGPRITVTTAPLPSGGVFALCSDGIYKYCPRKVIARELTRCARGAPMTSAAGGIVSTALRNNTQDNYSLVLVRFISPALK